MQIHGGFAYNQNGPTTIGTIYNVPKSYKTFQYLWANRIFGPVAASILFLNNGQQVMRAGVPYVDSSGGGRIHFTQTVGGRLSIKKSKIGANLAGYYQGGRANDMANNGGVGTLINAYYLGVDINYTIASKYTIGVGMELLSGNSTVLDSTNTSTVVTNQAFSPLFGTNHKFNGWMDYFYVGNHDKNVGLMDIFIKFKAKLPKKSFIGVHAHVFLSNGQMAAPTDNYKALSSYLGTEIDFYAGVVISPWANIKLGYSQMIGSESLAILKTPSSIPYSANRVKRVTAESSNWAWLMITVKPSHTFKFSKKK